jgi:type III restriction enzyme
MARKRKQNAAQIDLLDARVATAPCVPGIREKVKTWREDGCKGVSDTTGILLNYWFQTDHKLPDGRKFKYHPFQREAVETLIYLYEVAKVRQHKSLVETFATRSDLRLLQYDDFARYCVKMATGSGKTKVMSLTIAWQFFNAVAEARDDFAKTFLMIAPNVIVFERLRTDFEGGRIFRIDPIIPPQLEIFWRDFQCYMRGEGERASSLGALYLTNVQQFYERQNSGDDEPEELRAVLGPKPPAQTSMIQDFDKRIVDRGGWLPFSTTRRTTPTMKKANGTRSFVACTRVLPRAWPRNSTSRQRRATARDSCSRGPSSIIRSSRRSSTM